MTIGKFLLCVTLVYAALPGPSGNAVNRWVYDSMQRYYYWAGQMPAHPDYSLPTKEFFKALLAPKDRFSYITDRNEATAVGFGFHYSVTDTAVVVNLVIPGSDAANKGLKRGTVITRINGKPVNTATIDQALCQPSVVLQLADSSRVALRSTPVPTHSVYATRVFEQQGKKTGYLAYFSCAESQDAYLAQQIGKLKQAGVSELILDLRYNGGGSVASVTKLAAMLVPVFNPAQTFIRYTSNRGVVKLSFQQVTLVSNLVHLPLKRIYILTGRTTASAAELLINNLSPFMPVIRIGETTRGKDEAAFPITDPAVSWTLMPTIYKIADAKGRGNYAAGIKPDYFVKETSVLPLQQLGLPGDPLVDTALQLIFGHCSVKTGHILVTSIHCKPTAVRCNPTMIHCNPTTVHCNPTMIHCSPTTVHCNPTTDRCRVTTMRKSLTMIDISRALTKHAVTMTQC